MKEDLGKRLVHTEHAKVIAATARVTKVRVERHLDSK